MEISSFLFDFQPFPRLRSRRWTNSQQIWILGVKFGYTLPMPMEMVAPLLITRDLPIFNGGMFSEPDTAMGLSCQKK